MDESINKFLTENEKETQRLKEELKRMKAQLESNDNKQSTKEASSSLTEQEEKRKPSRILTLGIKPRNFENSNIEENDTNRQNYNSNNFLSNTELFDLGDDTKDKAKISHGLSNEENQEYLRRFSHLYEPRKSSLNLPEMSSSRGKKSSVHFNVALNEYDSNKYTRDQLTGRVSSANVSCTNDPSTPKNNDRARSVILDKNMNPYNRGTKDSVSVPPRRRHTELPNMIAIDNENPIVNQFQTNIVDIKNKLKDYERGVDDINAKLDINSVQKIKELTKQVIDLQIKLRLQDEEKQKLQDELREARKDISDSQSQSVISLKKSHLEELTTIKKDYESKIINQRIDLEDVSRLI